MAQPLIRRPLNSPAYSGEPARRERPDAPSVLFVRHRETAPADTATDTATPATRADVDRLEAVLTELTAREAERDEVLTRLAEMGQAMLLEIAAIRERLDAAVASQTSA